VLDNLQVALWAELFVTFVVSAILVCAGKRPGGHLLVFITAGLMFQVLTLAQPHALLGVILIVATWLPAYVRLRRS
jgi:hypothetical protein